MQYLKVIESNYANSIINDEQCQNIIAHATPYRAALHRLYQITFVDQYSHNCLFPVAIRFHFHFHFCLGQFTMHKNRMDKFYIDPLLLFRCKANYRKTDYII